MKKIFDNIIYSLTLSALLVVNAAQASEVTERERNDPISLAQIVIAGIGDTVIPGVLGTLSGAPVDDVDYFRFFAKRGDVITFDIDGAYGNGIGSVDTIMAVFTDGPDYTMLRTNDDAVPIDPGTVARFDSRIEDFTVPETGNYIVAVSYWGRYFSDGGEAAPSSEPDNGDYSLILSLVSSPVQHVNISVRPGNDKPSPLNPNSRGVVPVAILSSPDFDAMDVDVDSLTFGHTGDEASLAKCNKFGRDANHDGLNDLVCQFHNKLSHFEKGDLEGILKGQLEDGTMIEGRGLLRVIPEKAL